MKGIATRIMEVHDNLHSDHGHEQKQLLQIAVDMKLMQHNAMMHARAVSDALSQGNPEMARAHAASVVEALQAMGRP